MSKVKNTLFDFGHWTLGFGLVLFKLAIGDLGERNGQRRRAERFNECRMLGIKVADLVYNRRVVLLRLFCYLLHGFGRNLFGLFGRHFLLAALENIDEVRESASASSGCAAATAARHDAP